MTGAGRLSPDLDPVAKTQARLLLSAGGDRRHRSQREHDLTTIADQPFSHALHLTGRGLGRKNAPQLASGVAVGRPTLLSPMPSSPAANSVKLASGTASTNSLRARVRAT